jgi:hypothetical protein
VRAKTLARVAAFQTEPEDERETHGCWHYDYEKHCVQCDPASYGSCPADCDVDHVCCTCDEAHAACEVHADEDSCEDEEEVSDG